jgi:hypothetical protein
MDERCMSCGRGTEAGTTLFGARKRGRDTATGDEGFLCHACQPGSADLGGESTAPLSGRYAVIDMPSGPGMGG